MRHSGAAEDHVVGLGRHRLPGDGEIGHRPRHIAVAQQDCALWRGFIGEQICRSEDGTAITVAAAEGPASGFGAETGAALAGSGSDDRTLATLAPAAGPAGPDVAAFSAAQKVSGKKAEYGQDRDRPEQAQARVLARRPVVVRRRLYGWPDGR